MKYKCVRCGVEFFRKHGARKYCSVACAQRRLEGECADCKKVISANKVRCADCRNKIRDEWPEKQKIQRRENAYRISREPRGRFHRLKKNLKDEKVPSSDPIWNFNFYAALIQDEQCHYCFGPLSPTGHALDRVINSLGHTAGNVVPCC